jgi:hypothetical protein
MRKRARSTTAKKSPDVKIRPPVGTELSQDLARSGKAFKDALAPPSIRPPVGKALKPELKPASAYKR